MIQLKEYRSDRFIEYIYTAQGKSALFNFWFILELLLLFFSFIIIFEPLFERVVYPVVFYYLVFELIFVLGKIIRKKVLVPKVTGRFLFISCGVMGIYLIGIYNILFPAFSVWPYAIIFTCFLFMPLIIFLSIFLSYPLVFFLKKRVIAKAMEKSTDSNNVLKIGITGSFGKSSVKEYLAQLLSPHGKLLKTPENINTEMGVSQIIIKKLSDRYHFFIAEMGAYKIGEIALLGNIVDHKDAFLTGIGTQHIGLFGNLENTKKGKFEILEKVIQNKGKLYLNYDNIYIQEYLDTYQIDSKHIVKYGISSQNLDIQGQIVGLNNGYTRFNIFYHNNKYELETNLLGNHNILNLTGVIGYCLDQSISIADIRRSIREMQTPKSTLEIHTVNNTLLIDDTYNLSEDALYAGLNLASSFKEIKNLHLILDDILELGHEGSQTHKNIARKIAETYQIDSLCYLGINYKKHFIKGLVEGGFKGKILKQPGKIEENSLYLYEGRAAQKYFLKAIKNV